MFDKERPINPTADMRGWRTIRPNILTQKSHISPIVGDSSWKGHAANVCETRPEVVAYAKNDHLDLREIKGEDTPQSFQLLQISHLNQSKDGPFVWPERSGAISSRLFMSRLISFFAQRAGGSQGYAIKPIGR